MDEGGMRQSYASAQWFAKNKLHISLNFELFCIDIIPVKSCVYKKIFNPVRIG